MANRGRRKPVVKSNNSLSSEAWLYIRVSSQSQEAEGFSLEAQDTNLRRFAESHGLSLTREFCDVESAKRPGRPQFNALVSALRQRARTGNLPRILVDKVDRLYRNFPDYITFDKLGVTIHFVRDGETVGPGSTPSQTFMHELKVSLAKMYSANLSEEVKKGKIAKANAGMFPALAPLGYLNVRVDKRSVIQVDQQMAELVRTVYQLYGNGKHTLKEVCAIVNREALGIGKRKSKMSRSGIYKMLTNPMYIGKFIYDGETYAGTHAPLISAELWEKVQSRLVATSKTPGGYVKHEWMFRRLVTCGHCGCMYTAEIRKKQYVYYHCTGNRGGYHGEPYVPEKKLDEAFAKALDQFALDRELAQWLGRALEEAEAGDLKRQRIEITKSQHRLDELTELLRAAYADKLQGRITEDQFNDFTGAWQQEQRDLKERLALSKGSIGESKRGWGALLELARTASERYKCGSPTQKRKILEITLSNSSWKGGELTVEYEIPFTHLASLHATTVAAGGLQEALRGKNEKFLGTEDSNLD